MATIEQISDEAYRVADHILDVMRELGALAEHATEATEGFAPRNGVEDALLHDAYDVLNAANLAKGVISSAYDVMTTLAAY